MKLVFAFLVSFVVSAPAFAATSQKFVTDFVAEFNQRVTEANKERLQDGKVKFYCASLSQEQIALVSKYASVPNITIQDFSNQLADELNCYEMFWQPWGRKDMRGTLFNTKSFVMNYTIIQDTLNWMHQGYMPYELAELLESYNPR